MRLGLKYERARQPTPPQGTRNAADERSVSGLALSKPELLAGILAV